MNQALKDWEYSDPNEAERYAQMGRDLEEIERLNAQDLLREHGFQVIEPMETKPEVEVSDSSLLSKYACPPPDLSQEMEQELDIERG